MDEHILYVGSLTVFVLYLVISLVILRRRTCISSAASFLFLCALWAELTLFIVWLLIPLLAQSPRWVNYPVDGISDFLRDIVATRVFGDIEILVFAWGK
jgi:hypothetical protein